MFNVNYVERFRAYSYKGTVKSEKGSLFSEKWQKD